jgi:two-component sensor histidine kinase
MEADKSVAFRPGSMADVRDRLANFTLLLFTLLGLPTIIISLLRIREFGWMPSMYVHLAVYLLIVALCVFRNSIPHQVKAGMVLALLFILGSASFPAFATAGSGIFFYLVIVVLGTLYYGFRGGTVALVSCLAGLFAAMAATLSGHIDPAVDLNFYALSVSSWSAKIAAFTLLGGLCLGLMSLMQKWLLRGIQDMEEEIEEHRQTENHLQDSLAEKEVLLREVHHRVKSNLHVVMSLLDLHLSRTSDHSDSRAIADSKNRLRVMAQIHEDLYSSRDLSSIDFSQFLGNLASGILDSYALDTVAVKLDLRLEPADLIVDTAIPCGLIVNELISNSLKYAFEDRKRGTIRIEFSQMGEDQYRLIVADNGVGFSPTEAMQGDAQFGLTLIEAVSHQLGAETTFTSDGGTTFTMVFREYREAGAQVY